VKNSGRNINVSSEDSEDSIIYSLVILSQQLKYTQIDYTDATESRTKTYIKGRSEIA